MAGNDIGFWQGRSAIATIPEYPGLLEAVRSPRIFGMALLYFHHEGGQHAVGRFALAPFADSRWLCSVVGHWNLDRPDPRDR
jgi:hypothetical protein